jgi:DNA anti-recombination protein RmuC
MPVVSSTLVSAVSAGVALFSLVAYLYSLRRTESTAAREEALALAQTRAEMLAELRQRLDSLERRHRRTRVAYARRNQRLEAALEQSRREAREQAYQMQRLYTFALTESLTRVADELEEAPPDVEGALAEIRALLGDKRVRSGRSIER